MNLAERAEKTMKHEGDQDTKMQLVLLEESLKD